METLVKTYLSEFNYTKNHISQFNNENYTMFIYINASCIKELALEIPFIDFQSCYEKVQNAYNISEDLIISIAEKRLLQIQKHFILFIILNQELNWMLILFVKT